MKITEIMTGSPPSEEAQVTRANWRTSPLNRWSFSHIREVLPTAEIRRSPQPTDFAVAPRDLLRLGFEHAGGKPTTVAETLRETYADALVVLHRGAIVAEWYGDGITPTTPHMIYSISKSVAGALGGVLVERGLIDPQAPVTRYVPELAASVYGGCTVRHLLDMTVAIAFTEDYENPTGDVAYYRFASGWDVPPPGVVVAGDQRSYLPSLKGNGQAHGEVFHYVSPNTEVLGWVYERVCRRSYAQIVSEYLWQPMGAADDASMTLDAKGMGRFAGGISATARDVARFGEMIRRRGIAGGRQVIPGWWIDDIHANGDQRAWAVGDLAEIFPGARYRSKWYTIDPSRGDLAAIGIHGQWIHVDEATDTVIVKLGSQPKAMDIPLDHRWLAAFRAIEAHLAGA